MPLVYQQHINEVSRLGIWHITEPEDFFLASVPIKKDVSHPHKRRQHLAGRFLLPTLFADFPLAEILVADTRKPFLKNEQYHFSISHCGDYAAAYVSRTSRVGVDIEKVSPRIEHISHKFVESTEMLLWNGEFRNFLVEAGIHGESIAEFQTLLWSAKEAIYKWYGTGELDFKKHLQAVGPLEYNADQSLEIPFIFRKGPSRPLTVKARFWNGQTLAWIHTPADRA